jgi:MGT family glycosyltransferase
MKRRYERRTAPRGDKGAAPFMSTRPSRPFRVLLSSTPELSHLAPQLPLARELQTRGHDVLIACSRQLGDQARRNGLRSVACGLDLDPDRLNFSALGLDIPADLTPETSSQWAVRALFAETFAPPMARELRRIAEEFRPDVMIRDRSEYASWAVSHALRVPGLTLTFGLLPDRALDANARDALNELRRHQGLGSDPALGTLYDAPVLVPAPAAYANSGIAVLPSVHFVQPMLHDASGEEKLPPWVSGLGGRPVVYVTMGNIFNRAGRFKPVIEALADEPVEVIVTVGRSLDPTSLGSHSDNVHIERYIPQSLLLDRVDAIVCHGGFNTVMGALRAGVPLVIAPSGADQPIHASRCRALGAAVVVGTTPLDPTEIRAAVRAALGNAAIRKAARAIAADIAALPDVSGAAEVVERAVLFHSS